MISSYHGYNAHHIHTNTLDAKVTLFVCYGFTTKMLFGMVIA